MESKAETKFAVFLDRDGVINRAIIRDRKPYPPSKIEDLVFPPGTSEAIQSLRSSGYLVIVVTNQPDVAKGVQSKEVVESIHGIIRQQIQVDDIKVCYHIDEDNCLCRKPKPGMILDAAQEYSIDLSGSYMIGDRWRDIEAGKAAGCKTILIRPEINYNEPQAQGMDAVAGSLYDAAAFILKNEFDKRGNN
ncbi:MAG: HAD family hydrolase [Deltaproteobacteria bacterium]|nr:HAD family hydrolase [Deltaproteobacteria bacterium]